MRWFFAILFIVIGAFLFSLTIDDMGYIGLIIKIVIGIGCFFIAGFNVRDKKKNNKSHAE